MPTYSRKHPDQTWPTRLYTLLKLGSAKEEFYPDIYDRAAWAKLVMLIDLNSGTWAPDQPDVDRPRRQCCQ